METCFRMAFWRIFYHDWMRTSLVSSSLSHFPHCHNQNISMKQIHKALNCPLVLKMSFICISTCSPSRALLPVPSFFYLIFFFNKSFFSMKLKITQIWNIQYLTSHNSCTLIFQIRLKDKRRYIVHQISSSSNKNWNYLTWIQKYYYNKHDNEMILCDK